MPRMYPATVRRQIAQRLRSGEAVAAIAVETGIAQATLFRWKRQALIDAGVIEGTPSFEIGKLPALGAPASAVGELRVEHLVARGHRRIAYAYTGIARWKSLGDYWVHGITRAA